jgi:hypothetical protein
MPNAPVTRFIVSFARQNDIDTLITLPVAYECDWTETEEMADIIIECAYAVAATRGTDLDKHEAFMISHERGDFRFDR